HDRAHGEDAAVVGRLSLPPIERVDAGGWIAWALAGLYLFALPDERGEDRRDPSVTPFALPGETPRRGPWVPKLRAALAEARRVMAALALLREGNLTRAAAALGTSRRALREVMKDGGLYPWPRVMAELREHHQALENDDTSTRVREPVTEPTKHDGAPSRVFGGNPVHERGLRLSANQWAAVVYLPY